MFTFKAKYLLVTINLILKTLILLFSYDINAEIISGKATIVDGDTVKIDNKTIHLHGIDAPEMDQFCSYQNGKRYNCGHAAMRRLFLYIGPDTLECHIRLSNKDGTLSATCQITSYFTVTEIGVTRGEKIDLALEMVLTGHAFAVKYSSTIYRLAEDKARKERKGLWSGDFELPWNWRSRTHAFDRNSEHLEE